MQPLLVHRPAAVSFWIVPSIFAAVLVAVGLTVPQETTLSRGALLIIAAVAPFLAAVDWREHRLPDRLVLPAAAATLVVLLITAAVEQQWVRFGVALLCAVGAAAFFVVLFVLAPSQMGFGDVKLMLPLGLMVGWHGPAAVVFGVLLGLISGLLFGLVQILLRRADRKSHLALGPHLLIGALLIGFLTY